MKSESGLYVLMFVVAGWVTACGDGNADPHCVYTNNGVEACGDNLDNNCDGMIDEGCTPDCQIGQTRNCGVTPSAGVCKESCESGFWGTCRAVGAGQEVCGDNIDNDCDESIDEGCGGQCTDGSSRGCGATPNGGVCEEVCKTGSWGACSAIGSGIELCGDNLDNDCDNKIDTADEDCECTPGYEENCGGSPSVNLCVKTCESSGKWSACNPKPPNYGNEECDGYDNNCDGRVDEGCNCIDGEVHWCGGTPNQQNCHQVCTSGTFGDCVPVGGAGIEELCGNNRDDDCDGQMDEAIPCSNSCGSGMAFCNGDHRGDCQVTGAQCQSGDEEQQDCTGNSQGQCYPGYQTKTCTGSCQWSQWSSCLEVVGPSQEVCDGIDNNCDGSTDENITSSDSWGANDDCMRSGSMGTDPNDVFHAIIRDNESSDWYTFMGDDSDWEGWEDINIELKHVPAGADLDVFLYRGNCGGLFQLASSTNYGNADEELEWNEDFGGEDTNQYFIEIVNVNNVGGCYELTVDGLN